MAQRLVRSVICGGRLCSTHTSTVNWFKGGIRFGVALARAWRPRGRNGTSTTNCSTTSSIRRTHYHYAYGAQTRERSGHQGVIDSTALRGANGLRPTCRHIDMVNSISKGPVYQ